MWSAQSIEIIFNLMTNSHPTALKPLLCNFNFCITFHFIAEKSCWWEICARQRKLCKSCSDVSSNIEWARLKIHAKKKQHENLAGCYQLVLPCFSPTFPMEFIDLKIQKTVITWKPSLGFFCFDCSILLSKQKRVKWVGVFFCFFSDCFKVQSVKSCWH